MPRKPLDSQLLDYEPVGPARGSRPPTDSEHEDEGVWTSLRADEAPAHSDDTYEASRPSKNSRSSKAAAAAAPRQVEVIKRGHGLSYAGLFLFTAVVYFRPYELIPALAPLSSYLAFTIALLTLAVYVPAQLGLEGNLTARPREVKLVLLLLLTGLLSLPLAINHGDAWKEFVDYFKVVLMFIVMVNVARTEPRVKWLILLIWSASIVLSVGAVLDFRAGRFETGGERIAGMIGGMFGNPNDLAMHLATIIPLSFALMLGSRGVARKLVFLFGALLMGVGVILTYSRGGFLGMAAASLVLAWKLGRRHRVAVVVGAVVVLVASLLLTPGDYAVRITSIFDNSLDATGSFNSRRDILFRSIGTILHNPVFGVGMGCFHFVSHHEQVSHNAYTQVGAEMGVAALVFYFMFLLAPFKRLRQIERETLSRRHSRDYYWAVCLQAALVAYMVSSFFGSVAYLWYIYYLVAFAYCFHRLYESREAAREAKEAEASRAGEPDGDAREGWDADGAAARPAAARG